MLLPLHLSKWPRMSKRLTQQLVVSLVTKVCSIGCRSGAIQHCTLSATIRRGVWPFTQTWRRFRTRYPTYQPLHNKLYMWGKSQGLPQHVSKCESFIWWNCFAHLSTHVITCKCDCHIKYCTYLFSGCLKTYGDGEKSHGMVQLPVEWYSWPQVDMRSKTLKVHASFTTMRPPEGLIGKLNNVSSINMNLTSNAHKVQVETTQFWLKFSLILKGILQELTFTKYSSSESDLTFSST